MNTTIQCKLTMKLAWISFLLLISGCFGQYPQSAIPRSASEFGSKRMLNSFATIESQQLKITEFNEELSISRRFAIAQPEQIEWLDVKACDQYYLAPALSPVEGNLKLFFFALPDNETNLKQNEILFSLEPGLSKSYTAVAPSGRNFAFFGGAYLDVVEIYLDPSLFNWTIIKNVPISKYEDYIDTDVVMSDSKISFIYNITYQFIYNYKTKTIEERDLKTSSEVRSLDTYNDYWIYVATNEVILENPNGDLDVFNHSFGLVAGAFILPARLSATQEYIDIAVLTINNVVLGTLNIDTHRFEQYNTIPSKSLGLLDQGGQNHAVFEVAVGQGVLMYHMQNSHVLARPSLPGNHSCSRLPDDQLGVFWCSRDRKTITDLCPRGTYQPSSGYTTCFLCPEGTYQPNKGSIDCLPCKENEYCPLGTFNPQIISMNNSGQVTWDFPITETAAPTFEEILLMLLFASSITNTSISIVLLGCIVITGVILLSLLVKHSCGINLHQWLAKIDIHKKTKRRTTTMAKPSGTFKTAKIKVESVFGGYLTLLAMFILAAGLITTIAYVSDYHPLLVGQESTVPSQNSIRMSSSQDYSTQSKSADLANVIHDNLQLNISVMTYNFQQNDGNIVDKIDIEKCFNQYGGQCQYSFGSAQRPEVHGAILDMQTIGTIRFTEAEFSIILSQDVFFTFATVEISVGLNDDAKNSSEQFQFSTVKYLLLPSKNKVLCGPLEVPVTMTVVVRETQVSGAEEFNRKAYLSFVANEEQLQNLGHSAQDFALTNEPITLQFVFKLDETWRLESEQRRFNGVGAFFAALLAILGLYEVTLLTSELAHWIFHSIEKRHKKRTSKYQALEEDPLIVNEKSE